MRVSVLEKWTGPQHMVMGSGTYHTHPCQLVVPLDFFTALKVKGFGDDISVFSNTVENHATTLP
jgi:hypothetical protein